MSDSRTRVAFFSHSSALAGAERCLLELVQQLVADFGFECLVVAPSPGPLVDLLEAAGARTCVAYLPWWTYYSGITDQEKLTAKREELAATWLRMTGEVVPILEAFEPHLVVSNTIVAPWGAMAASLLDKPHVWSVHEFADAELLDSKNRIAADVLRASTRVIACSDSVRDYFFPGTDGGHVRVVNPSPALPETEEGAGGFAGGTIKLGVFGIISPAKGQLDAVLATHRLLDEGYSVDLSLTGYHDTHYVDAIRKYIDGNHLSDAIRVNDFTPTPAEAIRAVDIVISCSRHEAFGRGVVEAMLLGKPVVFPDMGGPTDYLEDGVTGLAYTPGNYFELACQIKSLIDNPALSRDIAGRARRFAREKFANATYAEKIAPILREAIEERNRGIVLPRPLILSLESRLRALSDTNGALQQALAAATADAMEKSRELNAARQEADELRKDRQRLLDASERKDQRLQSLIATLQFKNAQISQLSREAELLRRNLQSAAASHDADMDVVRSTASRAQSHLEYLRRQAARRSVIRAMVDALASLRAWMTHGVSPRETYAVRSSLYFDRAYYLENNPDVRQSGIAPEVHYVLHGGGEGRDPCPFFSSAGYRDVRAARTGERMNPLVHYEWRGKKEAGSLPP